jgi:hypothetical protein
MRAVELQKTVDPYAVLEAGDILVVGRSFFEEAPEDRAFAGCAIERRPLPQEHRL